MPPVDPPPEPPPATAPAVAGGGEQPPYCATCHRALTVLTTPTGVVTFRHGLARKADHRPVPVPLGSLAAPVIACDFCSADGATRVYRCAARQTRLRPVVRRTVAHDDYLRRHRAARTLRAETGPPVTSVADARWAACDGCASLIDQRDLYALVARVVDALPAKLRRGKRLAEVRGRFHDLYTDLFATLTDSDDEGNDQ
ncbi:MAG: hypothetical protein ACRDT2_07585 [Natronosporangium sp.]